MPTPRSLIAVAKKNMQNIKTNRYDLIGISLDYREGSEIGLFRLDVDRKHVEIHNTTEDVEELEKRLEDLDDWTYEIGQIYTNMDTAESLEGDLYYRDEDTWKFELNSYEFKNLLKNVFGEDIIEINSNRLVSDEYTRIES